MGATSVSLSKQKENILFIQTSSETVSYGRDRLGAWWLVWAAWAARASVRSMHGLLSSGGHVAAHGLAGQYPLTPPARACLEVGSVGYGSGFGLQTKNSVRLMLVSAQDLRFWWPGGKL
jgi:hypothetical protein